MHDILSKQSKYTSQLQAIEGFLDAFSKAENNLRDYGNGDLNSMIQVHLLAEIDRHPGITATELAAMKQKSKSYLSQTLSVLENKGYIERFADKSDSKKQKLFVTQAGRYLCEIHTHYDLMSMAYTYEQLSKQFSEEDIDRFFDIMRAYIAMRNSPEWQKHLLNIPSYGTMVDR